MKRLFTLFIIAVVTLFVGCEEPNGSNVTGFAFVEGTDLNPTIGSEGGAIKFDFKATTAWSVNVTETWLSVNPQSGTAEDSKFIIVVAGNGEDSERTATATVKYGGNREIAIVITQRSISDIGIDDTPSDLPHNEIWYTSTTDLKVSPSSEGAAVFGADIVSNEYKDGKGVIRFSGDVTQIGSSAFKDCTTLATILLPDSVTAMKGYAFSGCTNLESIYLGNSLASIDWCAMIGCSALKSVSIPNSVTTISNYAFSGCTNLESVGVGNGVESIGYRVFSDCPNLRVFKGVFAKDNGRALVVDGHLVAFAPAGVTQYAIPADVTSIGGAVFAGCGNLESVTIPESVTTIGEWAFENCKSLKEVHCRPTTPPMAGIMDNEWMAFDNNAKERVIYVRHWMVEDYKAADGWSKYAESIEGNDDITDMPTSGAITLVADRSMVEVGQSVKLTVLQHGVDVTSLATIYDAETMERVENRVFTATESGVYTFVATRDTETSNELTISALKRVPTLPEDATPTNIRFNHRILVIDHTASGCGYCPQMIDKLRALHETEWADHYSEVTSHAGGLASNDPARSDAATATYNFFKPGQPNLSINFYGGLIGNIEHTAFLLKMDETFGKLVKSNGADVGISVATVYDSGAVYASAAIKAAVEQEYRVTAWLLESDIYSSYQSGATKDYHRIYDHALRNIAGEYSDVDLSGSSMGVIKEGESVATTFELPILDSSWEWENTEVLIIVSALNTRDKWEVVNTAVCPVNSTLDFEYLK